MSRPPCRFLFEGTGLRFSVRSTLVSVLQVVNLPLVAIYIL